MKLLPLVGKTGDGKFTIIDEENYPNLSHFKWYMDSKGYVYREKSITKRLFLHQIIMGKYPQHKPEIDHINNDKSDNRKSNLRFCTTAENLTNKRKYKNNKSGYKGVQWHKQSKKWMARIYRNYNPIYLGLFDTAKKASEAVTTAEMKL